MLLLNFIESPIGSVPIITQIFDRIRLLRMKVIFSTSTTSTTAAIITTAAITITKYYYYYYHYCYCYYWARRKLNVIFAT